MVKFLKAFVNFDFLIIIILVFVFNSKVEFIKAGTIDESFKAVVTNGKYGEEVIQGEISDVKQQPDGKLIIAGNFIYFNNDSSNKHIIRIFPDGAIDTSFHSAFQSAFQPEDHSGIIPGIISTIYIQDDGKILVGGNIFETFDGHPVYNFLRLLPNGNLDKRFNKPVWVNGYRFCGMSKAKSVQTISKLNDSLLLLTGYLTLYDSHYVFMSPIIIDNNGELVNKKYNIKNFSSEFLRAPFSLRAFLNNKDDYNMSFFNRLDNSVVAINSTGKIIIFSLEGIIAVNQNGIKDSTFFTIPTYRRESDLMPKDSDFIIDQSTTNFAVLKDDKILVCGETLVKDRNNDLVPSGVAVVKYLPNGKIDHSFKVDSNSLKVIPRIFRGERPPILEDSDGKLIIGCSRFNKEGHLDDSFIFPNDRVNLILDSQDHYYFVDYNIIYKVNKYPKLNFFDLFSITLKN